MNILTISDLHAPFAHPFAVEFLKELKKKYKPGLVVCLGDEVDQHTLSRFASHPNAKSTVEELGEAIEFLKILYKLFPKVVVVESNHSNRHLKKAATVGIPGSMLRTQEQVLQYPVGWKLYSSYTLNAKVKSPIHFTHGEGYSGIFGHRNAAIDLRCNVVIGHLHSNAGINYITTSTPVGEKRIWGANAGCLVDSQSYAMEYGKHCRNKPCIGTIVIVNGTPVWEAL